MVVRHFEAPLGYSQINFTYKELILEKFPDQKVPWPICFMNIRNSLTKRFCDQKVLWLKFSLTKTFWQRYPWPNGPEQNENQPIEILPHTLLCFIKIARFLNNLYAIVFDSLRLQALYLRHGPRYAFKADIDIILAWPRVVLRRPI